MARRSAEPAGAARAAVVGAETPLGARVRAALERAAIPGSRVDLYGTTRGHAVLSEYAGEARLIQDPEPEEVAAHDAVFLCERSEAAGRIASGAGETGVVLDLAGQASACGAWPLVHAALLPPGLHPRCRAARIPHPLSSVLAEMLSPLERRIGVAQATATVLRPAADFGEAGLEELRDQTLRLLRFERVPREVFGRQLAFNAIPQALVRGADPAEESRIAAEVAELAGWQEPRLALRIMVVPVFHGHGILLRVALRGPATVAAVLSVLEPGEFGPCRPGDGGTMLDAPDTRKTRIGEVTDDGTGGVWLWAVAGEVGDAAAEQAILAARALAGL